MTHSHNRDEEYRIREKALDRTLAETFPASDPPSTLPNPDDHSLNAESTNQRVDATGDAPAFDARRRARKR
jgi:hypothetical protein